MNRLETQEARNFYIARRSDDKGWIEGQQRSVLKDGRECENVEL
jgi:hypothetical protein